MDDLRRSALRVLQRLREKGFEAYFAGGCVRDRLRGVTPKDYDIATAALPDEVIALFHRTVQVGKAFGVVKVLDEGPEIEVATFRSEGAYPDGRRPDPASIRFTSAREDVLRRDFTINGLLEDPFRDEILDFVGGRQDLQSRIIRTIGDPYKRFEEDRLRMLRAVRFAAELGFSIESRTRQAIRLLADRIQGVSAERIRDELCRLLTAPGRGEGLREACDLGLVKWILPEVEAMRDVPQPREWHPEGDVLTHTILTVERLEAPTIETAFGALLHDVGKPQTLTMDGDRPRFNRHEQLGARMAEDICRRLRLSRNQTQAVVYCVKNHMKFKDVTQMRESTLRRFLSEPHFEQLKAVHRADVRASNQDFSALKFVETKEKEFAQEGIRPAPLLRGRDLIALGLRPGPIFSEILRRVEDLQLDGRLRSREEAVAFVRRTWPDLF